MKVADVLLSWSRSVSTNIKKVVLTTVLDGVSSIKELGPEVESFSVTMNANTSIQYTLVTYNADGLQATSETATFSVDSLEAPQPATNLFAEITAIRDVPDPVEQASKKK